MKTYYVYTTYLVAPIGRVRASDAIRAHAEAVRLYATHYPRKPLYVSPAK